MKIFFKVFFIYCVLGLLVYFNSLNNKFIIDDYSCLSNPVLSETKYMFSQWDPYREQALGVLDSYETLTYYRPMAHMAYDFCYSTFKNNYWQYHLLNLFLFVFASSLVFILIEKITGNYNLAFLAGSFYLIHPINGIVVNYISASVFAFQVICMLVTILLLLGSLERKNNRGLYFLSLLFSFFSLFWNESGVMTFFYVFSFILLFRKDLLKEKLLYLSPYFLILISYMVFRFFFVSLKDSLLKPIFLFHMNFWEYLASLFQIFSWYIAKLFYPQGIVMKWTIPILHDHLILNVLGICLLLELFLLLFIRFSKEKICQLALAWLFIGFAPVCLAAFRVPENGAQIEPHWFVFSSIGFCILVANFCLFVLDYRKKVGLILLGALIIGWGSVSYAYNRLWADQKTYALYWSQHVRNLKSPYLYLAEADMREGDFKDAKKYCRMALSGHPSDALIYNNLGVIDKAEGHFESAESNYLRALKISPYSARIYNNLAFLYLVEGQLDKAKKNFNQSLMLDPLLSKSRIGLASLKSA